MSSNAPSQLRLRELREQFGWTQQEVAEQLVRLAWVRRRQRVGVNADMVAKWERGVKGVSRHYRELLCLLFGVDARELGLVNAPARPVPSVATHDPDDLVCTLSETAALLDRLGPAGAVLQPKLFEVWKDEIIRRRALLKLMTLAPAAGLAADATQRAPHKVTREAVQDLDDLIDRYQSLYHVTTPAVLLTPVIAHLETSREMLRQSTIPAIRRKLLANRARVATLAGRLTFFDLSDTMGARGYYNLALESAREAGDHHQAASVLGHAAFIPAADNGYAAALDYLGGANQHITKHPHGPLASWLAAVESEIHTNAGSHTAALAAIDRAREALASPGLSAELPWLDFYDETRLAGFAGYATLRAGRYDEARVALTEALDRLPSDAVKQRAVFLTDLATVHLQSGDLEEACRVAGEAVEQLYQAGYATGSGRLREFRAAVAQYSATPSVRTLDEQLALIA